MRHLSLFERAPAAYVSGANFLSSGPVVEAHGLSCSTAHGIFPGQGSNPCLLHWGGFLTAEPQGKSPLSWPSPSSRSRDPHPGVSRTLSLLPSSLSSIPSALSSVPSTHRAVTRTSPPPFQLGSWLSKPMHFCRVQICSEGNSLKVLVTPVLRLISLWLRLPSLD